MLVSWSGSAEQRQRSLVLQKMSRTLEVFVPKIPTVSSELAYATTPHREISPYDGLKPTVPVYAAGNLTEPPVSVPIALRETDHISSNPDNSKVYHNSRITLLCSNSHCTPTRAPTGRYLMSRGVSPEILHRSKSRMYRVRSHSKFI